MSEIKPSEISIEVFANFNNFLVIFIYITQKNIRNLHENPEFD